MLTMNQAGGPVVARKMESCESAALSRDLKTRQRLELVRSEKLTKMGGSWCGCWFYLIWPVPVAGLGRPVNREEDEALNIGRVSKHLIFLSSPCEGLLSQLLISNAQLQQIRRTDSRVLFKRRYIHF